MTTVSDLTTIPLSGLNHIDALLDSGPGWNYLQADNVINYTFSTASGNEDGKTGQATFSAAQQVAARGAFAYLSQVTGIKFVETATGTNAQIHLANFDISGATITGLCSWQSPYSYDDGTQNILSFKPQAWVYLDNNEWRVQNQDLTPGGYGYQTLLHELGHALGLKHPFEANDDNTVTLPASQDNTSVTLMSYTYQGGPYQHYNQDDLAALNWLYGADGLGGALGINSAGGRYITGTSGADVLTGTSANDVLQGDGGNDVLNGGAGTDVAVFNGKPGNYTFTALANGDLTVTDHNGATGTDTLKAIEMFKFNSTSGSIIATRADVLNVPNAPILNVSVNENGYPDGNTPLVSGGADPNTTIKLYDANHVQVGTATADAIGLWSTHLGMLSDGMGYSVYATETDAAGHVSPNSRVVSFNIDTIAPVTPIVNPVSHVGTNQVTLSGTGETGSTIMLVLSDEIDIGSATVVNGHWSSTTSALPSGDYVVAAVSVDKAGNSTSGNNQLIFSINSPSNIVGTAGNDQLTLTTGNNAVTGGAGIDTVTVNGLHTAYPVTKEVWGYGLTDNTGSGGHDHLIDIERIQFNDTAVALDIDGTAGMAYRIYRAAFDRKPDLPGLGYWIDSMDHGTTETQVAAQFLISKEFKDTYGDNLTDAQYITQLYANVLHRGVDQFESNYWLDLLAHNNTTRVDMLTFFSESPENQAALVGLTQNGVEYTPWHVG